jgi:predicted nuclease with TOPRIM domain
LRVLQGETAGLNEELEKLKTEWDEYKKPINEEIFANKQMLNERKVEYQYKNEKIKDLKKDFKKAVEDLEHKKKVHEYMKVEVEKMPKDVNRNQYLKRINEIIKTLKD